MKLKKLGKTTGQFRYDLNQILYDYTVEVRNRFKEIDLIEGELDELWMEVHDIVQETGSKTTPKEEKHKRQHGCLRTPYRELRKEKKQKAKGKRKDVPI